MAKFWNVFLRVVRRYSIEEKVVSMVVAVVTLVALIQGVIGIFRSPDLFAGLGVYSEGIISDRPALLNPLFVDFSEAAREISSLVFSGLVKYDPIILSFVPDLADLKISEDGKIYHFTLRDGLKWHDGEVVTTDDVYFTFNDVIKNPDFKNYVLQANFEGVEIQKLDDKNINFVLTRPNSFFITNFNVGIVPKHILEKIPVSDLPFATFNLKPVGSGPYKVDSAMEVLSDSRQRVLLTAFDGYYGNHPKIKNIYFNIYPDSVALAKEKSALNVIAKVPKEIWDELSAGGRFSFSNYELPQYTATFFNMDSAAMKQYKVRLGLQKSLDKTELLKLLTNKTAVDTPLMYLNQSEWMYKFNLDEAKGALFDAGYAMDKNSESSPYRKDSKGNNLKLVMLARLFDEGTAQAEETKLITDFFKTSWMAAGVELNVQLEDALNFEQRLGKHDYDVVITGQSLGYNLDLYSYLHSSQAIEGGLNLSNYRSFAADALIARIRENFESENKDKLVNDLAKEISQDIPAIFLYRPSNVYATDGKVKGVTLSNLAFPSDRFASIARWCTGC